MRKPTDLRFLSGNQLKIIALIAMTADHVGKEILPEHKLLQILGRLAFPIFAYMIAEGCIYTKDLKKHLLTMAVFAALCQTVYSIVTQDLYMGVLVTFTLSIFLILILNNALTKRSSLSSLILLLSVSSVYLLCEIIPIIFKGSGFDIDYGFWGVMLPVMVYAVSGKLLKLIMATVAVFMICLPSGDIQWFSMLAIPLLAMYSGKRGKLKMKYLFYIYYPLHLFIVYLLSLLIKN